MSDVSNAEIDSIADKFLSSYEEDQNVKTQDKANRILNNFLGNQPPETDRQYGEVCAGWTAQD